MTAVTVTAADVRPLPGAVCRNQIAGVVISLGQIVAIDPSSGKLVLAEADDNAVPVGIVVAIEGEGKTACVAGEACSVLMHGPMTGFSGMTPGAKYYLSDADGVLDTATGSAMVVMGVAWSATILVVQTQLLAHAP